MTGDRLFGKNDKYRVLDCMFTDPAKAWSMAEIKDHTNQTSDVVTASLHVLHKEFVVDINGMVFPPQVTLDLKNGRAAALYQYWQETQKVTVTTTPPIAGEKNV